MVLKKDKYNGDQIEIGNLFVFLKNQKVPQWK